MKEIYSFKEKLEKLIDLDNSKVWLSEKQGRRVECVFKVGAEQFIDSIKIFENDSYILLGQNIKNTIINQILEEINE